MIQSKEALGKLWRAEGVNNLETSNPTNLEVIPCISG